MGPGPDQSKIQKQEKIENHFSNAEKDIRKSFFRDDPFKFGYYSPWFDQFVTRHFQKSKYTCIFYTNQDEALPVWYSYWRTKTGAKSFCHEMCSEKYKLNITKYFISPVMDEIIAFENDDDSESLSKSLRYKASTVNLKDSLEKIHVREREHVLWQINHEAKKGERFTSALLKISDVGKPFVHLIKSDLEKENLIVNIKKASSKDYYRLNISW